jgi:hypothetical protein
MPRLSSLGDLDIAKFQFIARCFHNVMTTQNINIYRSRSLSFGCAFDHSDGIISDLMEIKDAGANKRFIVVITKGFEKAF